MSSCFPINPFPDQALLIELREQGVITNTFCRLNPTRQMAVIESILDEAATKGPTLLNIKEVASRADVSVGSLYQYFNNRQGLLDFAIEIVTRHTVAAFEYYRPYIREMSLREALQAYIQGGFEWAEEANGFTRFFTRAAYQDDSVLREKMVCPVAEVMLKVTRDILEAARERGELREDIDFEATVRLVNSFIIAIFDAQTLPWLGAYFQLTGEDMTSERITEAMINFIERSLKR